MRAARYRQTLAALRDGAFYAKSCAITQTRWARKKMINCSPLGSRIRNQGLELPRTAAAATNLTSPTSVRTFLRLASGTHLAQVAELVDALVSGTSGAIRGGSSPLLGTTSHNPYKNINLDIDTRG